INEVNSARCLNHTSEFSGGSLGIMKKLQASNVSGSIANTIEPVRNFDSSDMFLIFPVIGKNNFFKFVPESAVLFYSCSRMFGASISENTIKLFALMFIDFDIFQASEYPELEVIFFSII